jgi:hypothetical protein
MSKSYINCPVCGRRILSSRSSTHFLRVHDESHIILRERKGERVEERLDCNGCGKPFNVLWKFTKTNRGVVYLCPTCIGIARKRSFYSKDLLDSEKVVVNSFETNRRKH